MDGVFERGIVAARGGTPWGSASSIALHMLFIGALLLVSPVKPLVIPPPEPVRVEIVTQQQFDALQTRAEAPTPLAAPAPVDTGTPKAGAQDETRLAPTPTLAPDLPARKTHMATQFYSAAMLKEPGMARIRQTLGTLSINERVVQLCNIEGLEQIRRALPEYVPDTLVGYAMADIVATGFMLRAAGGAFRSRRKWYGIAYSCTAAPDLLGVTAFELQLGEPIPEAQWEAHNLNAADADE